MKSAERLSLERLWPNRAHESNWFKDCLCRLGWHRWHRLEVGGASYRFCRWCPEIVDDK